MTPGMKTSRRVITVPRRGIVTNNALDPSFGGQEAMDVLFKEPTRCLHTLMARGRGANLPLINGHHGYLSHSGVTP